MIASLGVQRECSRLTIDLHGAEVEPAAGADASPTGERLRHARVSLQGPRDRRDAAAAVAVQHHVLGEQRLELLDLAVAGGGDEAPRQLVTELGRGFVARPPLLHVTAGSCGQLSDVVLALPDDLCDAVVLVVEHLAQEEGGALLGREALENDEKREGERVGELRLPGGVTLPGGDERLGEPLAGVGLAPDPRGAQLVDGQPGHDGRDVRPRRLDPLTLLERAMEAEEALLHDVLRLAHAAQHPVRDRERRRPQRLEQVGAAMAQPSPRAKPSRQLG